MRICFLFLIHDIKVKAQWLQRNLIVICFARKSRSQCPRKVSNINNLRAHCDQQHNVCSLYSGNCL